MAGFGAALGPVALAWGLQQRRAEALAATGAVQAMGMAAACQQRLDALEQPLETMQTALALRQRLYRQPFYRLVHGESDGLPGLVVSDSTRALGQLAAGALPDFGAMAMLTWIGRSKNSLPNASMRAR